jgi:predicted adenine nucleotide alpha hydrolase (AANH) superfamily ATPase
LKDEKKLKKFLNAWQENGDDKRWKDYVKGSHPESAKRLNILFERAAKYLGNSSIDNFSTNFNQAKEREIKATEIASLSARMLKDVSWLESTFTNGGLSLLDYGMR